MSGEPQREHVYPVGDLVEHEFSEDCVCGPVVEAVDVGEHWPKLLFIHHSLVGRENCEGTESAA